MSRRITTPEHAFELASMADTAAMALWPIKGALQDVTAAHWMGGETWEAPAHQDVLDALALVNAAQDALTEASHILAMHAVKVPFDSREVTL